MTPNQRINKNTLFEGYNRWVKPATPVDFSTVLDGVKQTKVDSDDLNLLTSKFVSIMIEAARGATSSADMYKKVLTRIHESYKKQGDDAEINKKRQKFFVMTTNGETITGFDVDTSICDHGAVIYGYSIKPGHLQYNIIENDPRVVFDMKKKSLYNSKEYFDKINHIDTFIVSYDHIAGIEYPSSPTSVHDEYMNTVNLEGDMQDESIRIIEEHINRLKRYLDNGNIVEFVRYFSEIWTKSLRDADCRYYVPVFNKRQELWKLYMETISSFTQGSSDEYQKQFFTDETISKLKLSLTELHNG